MRDYKPGAKDAGRDAGETGSADQQLAELRMRIARDRRAIQRKASEGAEGAGGEAGAPKAGADSVQAIPGELKVKLEAQLGADLSAVKIHTGPQAEQLAESMGAKAFAQGTDIYFGKVGFQPGSKEGQELLAHELVHVVQQGGAPKKADAKPAEGAGEKPAEAAAEKPAEAPPQEAATPAAPQTKPKVSTPGDAAEKEADSLASQLVAGEPAKVSTEADAQTAHRAEEEKQKLPRPETPGNMGLAEFGRLIGWGGGHDEARARIGTVQIEDLRKAGVTKEMAMAWERFYENESARNPDNPSAAGRKDLMAFIAGKL